MRTALRHHIARRRDLRISDLPNLLVEIDPLTATLSHDAAAQFVAADTAHLAGGSVVMPGDASGWFISLWFRLDVLPSVAGNVYEIISNRNGSTGYRIRVDDATDKVELLTFDGSTRTATWGAALSINTWYNLIVGYDGTDIFIKLNDGAKVENTNSYVVSTLAAPLIGAESTPALYFDGRVDEVVYYERIGTDAEFTSLYAAGAGISKASIDAHVTLFDYDEFLQLDEEAGEKRTSSSGYEFTETGGTIARVAGVVTSVPRGNDNSVLFVAADNRYLSVPIADFEGQDAGFAVSCFIYLTTLPSVTGNDYDVIDGKGPGNDGYFVRVNTANDKIQATVGTATGSLTAIATAALVVGQWFHILLEWDGTNVSIRIDNGTAVTNTDGTSYVASLSATLNVGSNAGARDHDGRVDSLTFLDRITTSGERVDFAAGMTGAEVRDHATLFDAVEHWDFEEPAGDDRQGFLNAHVLAETGGEIANAPGINYLGTDTITVLNPAVGPDYDQATLPNRPLLVDVGPEFNSALVLEFDGVDDVLEGTDLNFAAPDPWAVICAVRETALALNDFLGIAGSGRRSLRMSSGRIGYNDGANTLHAHTKVYDENEWAIFAVVHDGADEVTITPHEVAAESFAIAATQADLKTEDIGSVAGRFFEGQIAALYIFDRALTDAEVVTALQSLANRLAL